ncbi:AMP-binding protein [Pseudonocardia broussonetiae]|uniref:AMP-binding protein n=1 Tax=Pseudonocardia broussonetiae TaxID=2736640 RepID=A0A6M6JBD5_9PSEU|nr:AMP-binding protein [Pseudonocardia broussonetiae]QJY44463.1 AMP-binding protein [Pseudonocardia broussonetiae]
MVVQRVWTGVRAVADEAVGSAVALRELNRAGLIGPVRPDRLARMATAALRYRLTVTAGYEAGAARHPDRPAILDDDGRLTFGELHERTDRIAQALAADGVGPGTRVGVLCRNHRGPVEVQIATGKLGADVVLFNTGMSAGQRAAVVEELGVHTLLADDEFTDLPDGCRVVRDLSGLIARGGPDPLPFRPPAGHTIVLTSGTTGPPKGARRPPPHNLAPIAAVLGSIPLRAGEPVHIAAPLLHTWGHAALQIAMLLGSPVVLARKYEPERFLQIAGGCDAVFAVPVMLQRLLEQDLEGRMARVVAVSGSALPAGMATAFLDRYGDCLYNLYGSTEVSWVSIAGPEDLRAAPGTAGRAPLGTRLKVLDEHGDEVPPGVEGRVFVGNDMPFEGYTRQGADVERHGDLMGTGDVGRVDEHGRLHLTGRGDDMIVSGGENVHPGPVEDLIVARAEVREAAVTGVDDDEYGQRLAAYVVLEPGATVDADTVREWVRAELSRFAVPRDVVFLDELPRNATGKVVHRELAG